MAADTIGRECRPGDPSAGECAPDGSGCEGEEVQFQNTELQVKAWDRKANREHRIGSTSAFAIVGKKDTWQMYLHGPLFRVRERASPLAVPPVYVFATWMNKIYRFENFSTPVKGQPMTAVQKVVGHALAPSTAWPVEDAEGRLEGLLVAEGQPWWFSNLPMPREIYKGGVDFLPVNRKESCSQIFPTDMVHRIFGQVVNTVDCHQGNRVCFFTVWKFYDDQWPVWTNMSQKIAPDCVYYCVADKLDGQPSCSEVGVLVDEHGQKVCHQQGKGAVHGMTIGNTDPTDPTQFDIFLVYTGGMNFGAGESSMRKVRVKVAEAGPQSVQALRSEPFAADLFSRLPQSGMDVGGDHVWVDETRKWVWVSTFREAAAGVHLVRYDDGALVYSIEGVDSYLRGQYAYAAGIHGVGTAGKPGSYLALATSACHSVKVCAPMPWAFPIPSEFWAAGIFFIIDLSTVPAPPQSDEGEARQTPEFFHV